MMPKTNFAMTKRSLLFAALCVVLSPSLSKAQEPAPVPSTHHVLVPLLGWERGVWGEDFNRWFAAMKTAGYAADVLDDKVPELSAQQLLDRYDAVALTTRSASIGVLRPAFEDALEEFVRQGGGLILMQTAGQESWIYDPINLLLPTAFYDTPRPMTSSFAGPCSCWSRAKAYSSRS